MGFMKEWKSVSKRAFLQNSLIKPNDARQCGFYNRKQSVISHVQFEKRKDSFQTT